MSAVTIGRRVECTNARRNDFGTQREAGVIEREFRVVDPVQQFLVEELRSDITLCTEIFFEGQVSSVRPDRFKERVTATATDDGGRAATIDAIADRHAHLIHARTLDFASEAEADDKVASRTEREVEARQPVSVAGSQRCGGRHTVEEQRTGAALFSLDHLNADITGQLARTEFGIDRSLQVAGDQLFIDDIVFRNDVLNRVRHQTVDATFKEFLRIIADDRAKTEIVQVGRTQQILVGNAKISRTACEDDKIFVRIKRLATIIVSNARAYC